MHTVTTDNILQQGVCTYWYYNNGTNCKYIPGNFTNNAIGDVRLHLRDPDNFDFRLNHNSDNIAKGIGPHGKECTGEGGVYWIPGYQQLFASMPIPPNGTTTAKCNADLMWLAGYIWCSSSLCVFWHKQNRCNASHIIICRVSY